MKITHAFRAAAAVLTASLAASAPAALDLNTQERADRDASHFAVNGTKMFHIPEQIDTKVAERAEWMRELGVYWDRIDLWWHVVEPEKGKWDFSRPDRVFDEFENHHIQWYPILCYGAAWWGDHNAPQNEEQIHDFGEYVYRTVDRYKDRVTYWSAWNEPNIPNFWQPAPNPDVYAALLKETYTQMKKADPDAKLGAPVLAPLGHWDRAFTERIFQLGAMDDFDVFDYHFYRNYGPEAEVPDEIAEIRAVMNRYGKEKPIWISESGVTSPAGLGSDVMKKQASIVARNQLLCFALGVERFFYFDLQNWYDDKDNVWDSSLGLVTASGEKKPSFTAYQTMVKETDYRDFVGRVLTLGDGVQGVLVHDPGTDVYTLAVWTQEEKVRKEIEVACEPRDAFIVEATGNMLYKPVEVPRAPGETSRTISVPVDNQPRYIRPVDPSAYLPEAGVKIDPPMVIVTAGEEAGLRLLVSDLLTNPKARIVSMNLPKGIEWDATAAKLRCGVLPQGVYEISANVSLEFGGPLNRKTVQMKRTAKVEVTSTVDLSLRPVLDDGKNIVMKTTLTNQTKEPIKGTPTVTSRAPNSDQLETIASGEAITVESLKPVHLDLRTDTIPFAGYEGVTQWQLNFGDFKSKPFKVYAATISDVAPVVDGDLSDWEGVSAMQIDEGGQIMRNPEAWTKADTSAQVYCRFTSDTVYFAAQVSDDGPIVNTHKPVEMWKGDAFEFYLGLAGPTDRTVLDKSVEFQIGLAPTTDEGEPVAFLFHLDKVLDDAVIKTKLIDGGYTLEAAIPVTSFAPQDFKFEPGMKLGLDVALDDVDTNDWAPAGNDPGRQLMWNGNGMNWINPSGWGMAVLKNAE